ncbi:hypothetical protein [Dulcicalothrix desertica]|uniref:hypothetical protein n=1 Tax=Dulcicalothrix desertica TaxID=32056 RepID=UPI003988B593
MVISHTEFNQYRGFAFVCPISNTKRRNPFYFKHQLEVLTLNLIIHICVLFY